MTCTTAVTKLFKELNNIPHTQQTTRIGNRKSEQGKVIDLRGHFSSNNFTEKMLTSLGLHHVAIEIINRGSVDIAPISLKATGAGEYEELLMPNEEPSSQVTVSGIPLSNGIFMIDKVIDTGHRRTKPEPLTHQLELTY